MNGVSIKHHLGAIAAIADQAIVSLSAFALGICLARFLHPEDYGVFVLVLSVYSTLSGVATALLWVPYRVLAATPEIGAPNQAHVFTLHLLISALLALTGAGFLAVSTDVISGGCVALAPLLFFFLNFCIDFSRAVLATKRRWKSLLLLDTLCYVTRFALVFLICIYKEQSISRILAIMTASMTIGLLSAWWISGKNRIDASLNGAGKIAKQYWNYGRWLLLENIAYALSTQYYSMILSLHLGTSALASFGAAQVFLNAFNVVLLGISAYSLTAARRTLVGHGYREWRRFLMVVARGLVGAACVIAITCTFGAHLLLHLVYGGKYDDSAHLMPLFGLVLILNAMNVSMSVAFKTSNLPQAGFAGRFLSAVVALAIGTSFVQKWAAAGAVIGLLLSQVCWLVIYFIQIGHRGALSEVQVTRRNAELLAER